MKQSPIEFLFLELVNHSELAAYSPQPQYRVGSYTLDLALAGPRIAVELDGHAYHASREQRTKDAKRDRFLVAEGWRVLRFTGSEVVDDPARCVSELCRIVRRLEGGTLRVARHA
jgi:very-short-patch-repair endonuclease